jgi:5-methylcytosine-specific restriction endonuclease McrA
VPLRFPRSCLTCGTLQRVGNRCGACSNKITAKRQRERGPQVYADPAWRKLSREMREEFPWCFACRATADLTVDHIIPLQEGQSPIVPKHMLAVLCRSCHGRKTKHAGRGG